MIALETKNLGKAYQIYAKPIDSLKEIFFRRIYHEKFWALQDICLSVPMGSALGIIGSNGSGKTTLLQILVGILAPSCGTVQRNGRVSAILELGSGFHPDLSGRDNIKLGCARMGIPPAEIPTRIAEIIEFSELQNFIDRPVKTYSTGMYARLAFSLAISVTPDILVVDEALSVGDQHFQKKSLDRMLSLHRNGTTMVFCSHDMYQIRKVCDRALWLKNGRIEAIGEASEVAEAYQNYMRNLDASDSKSEEARPKEAGPEDAEPEEVRFIASTVPSEQSHASGNYLLDVNTEGDIHGGVILTGKSLTISVTAHILPETYEAGVHIAITIVRNDQVKCYGVSTLTDDVKIMPIGDNKYGIAFVLDNISLLSGEYMVDVFLLDENTIHVYDKKLAIKLNVSQNNSREIGLVRLNHRWIELSK